jgi:hypothetical protein
VQQTLRKEIDPSILVMFSLRVAVLLDQQGALLLEERDLEKFAKVLC